ncbi:Fpg/Nei family DNA glycosylase [Chitinophagaceae bacterium MMS25-I14]
MPELPDLKVFSHNLHKMLRGKKVTEVSVSEKSKLNVSPRTLKEHLEGQEITSVSRSGKELYLSFDNGDILALHLMLRGQLYCEQDGTKHKYTILSLGFANDSHLIMADYQGLATPTLNPEHPIAPDALDKTVNESFLEKMLQKSRKTIKALLLDQHIIRGIGNAYADEILWEAGISPFSVSNKIPAEKVKTLTKALRSVLLDAEKEIRKSHPDIITGEYRDFLKIHNAQKDKSPGGAVIHHKMMSGRKTYYTDEQELYK